MRYQNKQRYPPIATVKPLPTLSQRGTAATATEITKDAANDDNEPPPGHRSGACCPRPLPMPGERRQNAHHRTCTPTAEFFSRADGLDDDGLAEIRAQSHHGSRLGPGIPRWHTNGTTCRCIGTCGIYMYRTSDTKQEQSDFPNIWRGPRAARLGRGPATCWQPHPSMVNV